MGAQLQQRYGNAATHAMLSRAAAGAAPGRAGTNSARSADSPARADTVRSTTQMSAGASNAHATAGAPGSGPGADARRDSHTAALGASQGAHADFAGGGQGAHAGAVGGQGVHGGAAEANQGAHAGIAGAYQGAHAGAAGVNPGEHAGTVGAHRGAHMGATGANHVAHAGAAGAQHGAHSAAAGAKPGAHATAAGAKQGAHAAGSAKPAAGGHGAGQKAPAGSHQRGEKTAGTAAHAATAPAAKGAAGAQDAADGHAAALSARAAIAPAISAVRSRAAGSRAHKPPGVIAGSAQAAAIVPSKEQQRGAAVATAAKMDSVDPGKVNRDTFKDKLKAALKAAVPDPKDQEEAERTMKSGGVQTSTALKGELQGQHDAAAGPMTAVASPQGEVPASSQPAPPAQTLTPEVPGQPPAPVSAAPVVPAPLPDQKLDYSADRQASDQAMAENSVTTEQLQKSNEPSFGKVVQARADAEKHEAAVPDRFRKTEAGARAQAGSVAQQSMVQGLGGIHGSRSAAVGKVAGQQSSTKQREAQKRADVTSHINQIKDQTRSEVNSILETMDREATSKFTAGLQRAEKAYESAFEDAKGGWGTWLTTWGDDWKRHIDAAFVKARASYNAEVDVAIDEVAMYVELKLKEAKERVAMGRKEIDVYVQGLDASSKQFGEEARQSIGADFDAMSSDIDAKRDALCDKLAAEYKTSRDRIAATEEKLREENKTLWDRVKDATVGVIKTIIAFKDMLLNVLSRAAAAIDLIISDPIGFLGNLVSAVMQGLNNFVGNILTHLKKGLMEWLFGALAGAGLQIPDSFDLKGIISLVLQVLGLTYANFRARAVAIVGEPIVQALESAAEVFKVIVTEGIPGLWRFIKEKLADLKTMVMDGIIGFVKEKIIVAGIKWIIGLLNPASAFVKACMAIYDIVMFFVNRGSQILALVNAIIDSITAIANGNLTSAANWVEQALARAIPVAIGFLASLLGLGDISNTIRDTIKKVQQPVNTAIDWVINQAVKLVKAAGKLVGGLLGKKESHKDDKTSPTGDPQHDAKVTTGLAAIGHAEEQAASGGRPTKEQAEAILQKTKQDHPVFTGGSLADGEDHWIYNLTASEVKKHGHGMPAECRQMIKRLEKIQSVQGVSKLIRALGYNLKPAQRAGYLFQAERTLFWHQQGALAKVELEFHLTAGNDVEISIFDIVIQEEEIAGQEDAKTRLVWIDTKHWMAATRLGEIVADESKPKAVRDDAASELKFWVAKMKQRLAKYRRLGVAVRIEWKGPIPAAIKELSKPAYRKVYGAIEFEEI
jgi:hypothetical protein